jgi:hemoglobin
VSNESLSEAPISHYDSVGGSAGVREAVERFYQRVLDDPRLTHYFTGVDIPRLKRHQVLLISQILGGPTEYDGRPLGEAHADLAITTEHYLVVGGHLIDVLTELQARPETIEAVQGALAAVQGDIVAADVAPSPNE